MIRMGIKVNGDRTLTEDRLETFYDHEGMDKKYCFQDINLLCCLSATITILRPTLRSSRTSLKNHSYVTSHIFERPAFHVHAPSV